MKRIFLQLWLTTSVFWLSATTVIAQNVSPSCTNISDEVLYTGSVSFNYGAVNGAFNSQHRSSFTFGQPVGGNSLSQKNIAHFGFWTRFLLPPFAPAVFATEGDLPDQINISWVPDPLSPVTTEGFKIYRNGTFMALVDERTFNFVDFNVIAGQFYTYSVSGINQFGDGQKGAAIGFVNPNGVVTGQVKSLAGNPVPGAIVTLAPTLGNSCVFTGDDMVFAEYNPMYPRDQFTLSTWVKLGAGNNSAAIIDLGSSISKNWWLHTLPAASGKGIRFGLGNGVGNITHLDYAFPAATADDWHNIAVSYNGSSLLLYADGELISTAIAQIASDSIPLFFGQKIDGSGSFTGNIDEVRFFDRQLAQTEIQMFLNTTVAPDMDGLVNYWKFDEGTGTKTFDLTATKQKLYFCGAGFSTDKPEVANAGMTNENGFYKIPGANYGAGTTFTARPFKNFYYNQSLEFNGVNQQFATLTDFDLADSSTVEITVKGFDFASNQTLLNKGSHFSLNLNAGNLILTLGSTTQNFGALGMGFHRLSFVIDQVAGSNSAAVTFYKDGTLVGSNTFSGVSANMAGGGGWLLGKNAGGNYFSGLIDEVVFYNDLLPLNEIQTAANVGTNVTNQKLINYFPLNEGEGDKIADFGLSLTGTGTVSGATWSTVSGIAQIEPHLFTPSSRFVTLNPSVTSVDGVDFTDQSTVPVSGYVRFDGTNCFQEKVEILVNGARAFPPVFTDSTGYFSIDLQPGATVQISPKFNEHTYFPPFWELIKVNSPVAGILFRNQTQRSIEGQMAGNAICRKSVIPTGAIVKVAVETLNGCFYQEQQLTNPNGKFKFDKLPPLPFLVKVTEHSNNVIYNYFQLQGGSKVDLTDVNDTTDFIYYSAPEIQIATLDTNNCGGQMLRQSDKYTTEIRVFQPYDGGQCYLDTFDLHIENLLADPGDRPTFDTTITESKFRYKFRAGIPNIVPPYTQTLTVLAKANKRENSTSTTAVILGKRPRNVNFTSTSPDIPLLILHDPPGDGSSASVEAGKKHCTGWKIEIENTRSSSFDNEIKLGYDLVFSAGVGFEEVTEVKVAETSTFSAEATLSSTVANDMNTCMTLKKTISTSSDGVILGDDADVYVGGALNLLFGVTDDVKFDTLTCSFFRDTGLVVFPNKFNTTFVYSDYQIRKVVIPNLELLGDTTSVKVWRDILRLNTKIKERSPFIENYTFDGGVTYQKSSGIETTEEESFSFNVEIGTGLSEELGFELDGFGQKAKVGLKLKLGVKNAFTNKSESTRQVNYTLADNDIKDAFTVNVLQDPVYGTPVFKTISGNSSCPYEPNTVPRDAVELTVDKTIAVNVGENEQAVFKFILGNTSETDEYRTYSFGLYNESNPNGAKVKVQGTQSSMGSFLIAPGGSQEVTVTVEKGPIAYDYEDLMLHIFSACEDARYGALGFGDFPPAPFRKAILLDVHFIEPCSPIDIGFPLQNWVWQANDGDSLYITLNKFNRYDADLELVRVQYRRKNGDGSWINIIEVPKAQLDNDVFKIIKWGTQDLQDGEYEIRAVTQCFGGQNSGISHVIQGRFEREAPALFGTPEPADGVLSRGDEISIRFNEPIRCDQIIQADVFNNNNIGLYDTETGQLIDAIISCQGDKIVVVPNVPNRFIENKVMRVEVNNIKDLANNVFVQKSWEFFVDRNPIRWEGGNVKVSKLKPEFVAVSRRILNDGGQATAFEIQGVPDWVRVFPTTGVIQPGAAEDITFEFDSALVFGNYLDTIRIDAPEGKEPLIVNCRVMCKSPDWKFSPAAYPHTMNFSLKLNVEGTLSTDEEDIVAAFIDGELRGTAKVQLLPTLPPLGTQYMVFLTVYGDADDDGKPVKLEVWDASACLRYGEVIEQFDFEVDNVIGTLGNPTILHTNSMVRRDIALTTGWNWISFNLLHPDPSLNAALASLKYPQNDLIKGHSAFSEYFGGNWLGSLAAVNNRNMFQFRADQPDTIQMRGALIDPASLSIPIAAGWNWVGYVPNYALTVSQALAGLTPLNGDIIKGQTSFAQYIAGFGWLGSLLFMEPPHGYQLKISLPGTLTYPPQPQNKDAASLGQSVIANADVHPSHWMVDATQFEHSMTLVGMFSAGGQNATLAGHEIGVFVGGQLRGSAQALYVEPLQSYVFFLTLFANTSGEQLQFKLYESTTGQVVELSERMYFVADLHQGGVESPVPFTLKTSGVVEVAAVQYLEVQPNPFDDATLILFAADHAQEVRLLISDATGRTVVSQKIAAAQGLNQYRWEAPRVSAGVYFVRLETSEGTAVRKVVKE